ncbi:MAG: aminotransferase class IV [Chloroflexi bacterium]|nr:aminotransferase class IV [Chloroflexota bacterium]
MSEIVYLNGALVPRSQAKIPALDYGFLYGYGLFETMRAYGGLVFRLDSHMSRLAHTAETLGLAVIIPELKEAVMKTIEANRLSDARIRLTVSGGEGSTPPDLKSCTKPTVLITASEYHPYPDDVYRRGLKAHISTIHRNSLSPLSRLKTANYLDSMLARQQAREAGFDEALLLNEKGQLAEASMSNVFLVSEGILKTPGLDAGILDGVTRGIVLELASQIGIKAVETDIGPVELSRAQEAFLTNSLIEIMPLTELDGSVVCEGEVGPVTGRLIEGYKRLVLTEQYREQSRHSPGKP